MKKLLIILILVAFYAPAICIGSDLSCDFDSDQNITSSDIAILAAWIQSRKSDDKQFVQDLARSYISTVVVDRLPGNTDKLEDSVENIGTNDLGFLAAYLQTRKSTDFSFVESMAYSIMSKSLDLSKLPGTPIGTASFTTTITGITTDP
jgi:hypothetical protein